MANGGKAPINVKSRLLKFGIFLLVWCLVIVVRLTVLQVLHYGEWVQRAQRQQQRTVEISPQRGIIYDRNGQELAMTVQVDSVFAVPSEISDQKNTATILAKVIGEDPDSVLERIQAQRNFAWIARKVDGDTAERIRLLGLHGIYFQKELKRFYPKRSLAAQVLGYVGMEDTGLAGIEHAYQSQLNGEEGRVVITMDARRKWFGHLEHPPEPGSNVVLTIDEKIQFIAEKELEQAMQETQALSGTVVVQNPRTGEILALANSPSFNPNLSREITPEKLKNHAVSDVYEPGSVFKTVTYSSAFEEKLARPEEVINCDPGYIMVGGIRIRDSHHIGTVTSGEGLRGIQRRGRGEDGAAPRSGSLLPAHPGIRLRTAYERGTAGRNAWTGAQSQTVGCLLDRFHGDWPGGWGHPAAGGLDDVVDCQRRRSIPCRALWPG